jgi:hypothetical protein
MIWFVPDFSLITSPYFSPLPSYFDMYVLLFPRVLPILSSEGIFLIYLIYFYAFNSTDNSPDKSTACTCSTAQKCILNCLSSEYISPNYLGNLQAIKNAIFKLPKQLLLLIICFPFYSILLRQIKLESFPLDLFFHVGFMLVVVWLYVLNIFLISPFASLLLLINFHNHLLGLFQYTSTLSLLSCHPSYSIHICHLASINFPKDKPVTDTLCITI